MSNQMTTSTASESVADRPVVSPAVDVYENQEEILIVADLPGVANDALSIDLDDDRLTIVGRRRKVGASAAPVLMGGLPDFDFKRVFTVPDAIDAEKINAELTAGVLRLHLPRHERSKPRRIAIRTT